MEEETPGPSLEGLKSLRGLLEQMQMFLPLHDVGNFCILVGHVHAIANASHFIMVPYFPEKEIHIHYSHHSSSGWQGSNYCHLLVN